MMARNSGNPANSLKEITDSVIRQKINGTSSEVIVSQLIARGWPELTARQFVANVSSNGAVQIDLGERYAVLRGYLIRMVRGFVCLTLGLVIVVVGLSMAEESGGLYYFAIGVLFCCVGSIDFLIGISGWWRHRI